MKKFIYSILLAITISITGCSNTIPTNSESEVTSDVSITDNIDTDNEVESESTSGNSSSEFDIASIPAYTSSPYIVINDNNPFFTEDDYTTEAFETYSDLDSLGRCGVAYANICQELMPTENRESISSVTPSGWVNNEYSTYLVDGGYLYNRCHLIGFQLAGENANEKNLITGTRYMNVEGMLPFENMVADYVKETDNHVLYRVTPVFVENNLVANGVLMEAWSVEDNGDGICFNVYVYNVQPGIVIDYATGDNHEAESGSVEVPETEINDTSEEEQEYVLNTNSMKFHMPDCSGIDNMSPSNREDYYGTREELIEAGYSPCGICNP